MKEYNRKWFPISSVSQKDHQQMKKGMFILPISLMIKFIIGIGKSNKVIEFLDKTGRANGTHFDKDGYLITCSDDQGEIWKISKDKK